METKWRQNRRCPHCNVEQNYMRKQCSACGEQTRFRDQMDQKRSDNMRQHYLKAKLQSQKWDNAYAKKKIVQRMLAELEGSGNACVILVIGKKPSYRFTYLTCNDIMHSLFKEKQDSGNSNFAAEISTMCNNLRDEYVSRIKKGELPNKWVECENTMNLEEIDGFHNSVPTTQESLVESISEPEDKEAAAPAAVMITQENPAAVMVTPENAAVKDPILQNVWCATLDRAISTRSEPTEVTSGLLQANSLGKNIPAVSFKPRNVAARGAPKISGTENLKKKCDDGNKKGSGFIALDRQKKHVELPRGPSKVAEKKTEEAIVGYQGKTYSRKRTKVDPPPVYQEGNSNTTVIGYSNLAQFTLEDEGTVEQEVEHVFTLHMEIPEDNIYCPEVV